MSAPPGSRAARRAAGPRVALRWTPKRTRSLLASAVAGLALALCGCPPDSGRDTAAGSADPDMSAPLPFSEPVGESPELVFSVVQAATRSGDLLTLYDYLDPPSREQLIHVAVHSASAAAISPRRDAQGKPAGTTIDPRGAEALDDLLDRYGLSAHPAYEPGDELVEPVFSLERRLEEVRDPRALLAELLAFSAARGRPPEVAEFLALEDLTIEGPQARAVALLRDPDGRERRHVIGFREVAGRWRLQYGAAGLPADPPASTRGRADD